MEKKKINKNPWLNNKKSPQIFGELEILMKENSEIFFENPNEGKIEEKNEENKNEIIEKIIEIIKKYKNKNTEKKNEEIQKIFENFGNLLNEKNIEKKIFFIEKFIKFFEKIQNNNFYLSQEMFEIQKKGNFIEIQFALRKKLFSLLRIIKENESHSEKLLENSTKNENTLSILMDNFDKIQVEMEKINKIEKNINEFI